MQLLTLVAVCLSLGTCVLSQSCTSRPNIVMVLVDDLGWSDVSFDGTRASDFSTPTIDKLNREGIRMLNTITPPNCSPSRHCLLSGLYPYRYGNQDNGISVRTTGHPPLDRELLPQTLRKYNYRSHMIGKWHEGFCEWAQTPINRGFSSWLGFYLGKGDHYKHYGKKGAYDLRFAVRPDSMDPNEIIEEDIVPPSESKGVYSTYMFSQRAVDIVNEHTATYGTDGCTPFFILLSHAAIHGPNQVPDRYITDTICKDIPDTPDDYEPKKMKERDGRRIKCGMMVAVDEGIKNITDALEAAGVVDNTIIAFTSDNGGSWTQGSSNFPLRGGKTTLWQGGTRVVSFLHSTNQNLLPNQNRDWSGLFYQTDWKATFVGAATNNGSAVDEDALDSINQWSYLYNNEASATGRTEAAYVNEIQDWHAALWTSDGYKLLVNQTRYPGWYHPPDLSGDNLPEGITLEAPSEGKLNILQLFNVAEDPSETVDLTNLPKPKKDFSKPQAEDYDTEDLYKAALKEYRVKYREFKALKKQWKADKKFYTAKAKEMWKHLNSTYWQGMWTPTNLDLKESNPSVLDYVVPGTNPPVYVWSPGWCENDIPDKSGKNDDDDDE